MLRLTTRVSSQQRLLFCTCHTFILTFILTWQATLDSCCLVAGKMQYDECNNLEDSMQPPAPLEVRNLHNSLPSCIYSHREGTREYMQAEVMPHIQRALEALAVKIQEERLKLAAGVEAEEGKYLPHGWRPFCLHRWMAEYLIAHKPQATGAAVVGVDMLETADAAAVAAVTGEQHVE